MSNDPDEPVVLIPEPEDRGIHVVAILTGDMIRAIQKILAEGK